MYLLFYNVVSFCVWSAIFATICADVVGFYSESQPFPLSLGFPALPHGSLAKFTLFVYEQISPLLIVIQSAALLEAIHPLMGLTRTPVSSALIQVGSRLVVLFGFTYWSHDAQKHWSLLLMLFSWSAVEVIRYSFYAITIIEKDYPSTGIKMPGWLFHARYNAFVVLYPTGISGEIGQILTALPALMTFNPKFGRLAHVLLALYVPLGPYMVMNMFGMRKRAIKKREMDKAAAAGIAKPLSGLVWPVTSEETGERSTSSTNKDIWAASIEGIGGESGQAAKALMNKAKNWRFGYVKNVVTNHKLCLESKDNALKIASQGLDAARKKFMFIRDGKTLQLKDAMDTIKGSFETGVITGEKSLNKHEASPYTIPYDGKNLVGDEAKKLLDRWVKEGTIEPTAAESIKTVLDHPEWTDLSDKYFVLLGATSAMGPLYNLLKLGANIIAIDLDREGIWKRLINDVRNSPGSITFPLTKPQKDISSDEELFKCAGANLLDKTPEIANWLSSIYPDKQLTVGNYTYLDGALHVQLALGCDLIMEAMQQRRKKPINLAFLCTPTDVHCIPEEANKAAAKNYKEVPGWQRVLENILTALGSKEQLKKNVEKPVQSSEDGPIYFVDGIVSPQGPNYALAKRLQHWRCVLAHQAGQIVSSNIAPSTATKSVVSNSSFAAAYGGLSLFKCMEVFQQETSSAVMLALLINDIRNPDSVSNLASFKKKYKFVNPFRLFEVNSCHGGIWRTPYKMNSMGITAGAFYYFDRFKILVVSAVAIAIGTGNYVVKGRPV